MNKQTRNKAYPQEFREQVVKLVQAGGQTVSEIAREFEISTDSVRRWLKQAERDADTRWTLTSLLFSAIMKCTRPPGPLDCHSCHSPNSPKLRRYSTMPITASPAMHGCWGGSTTRSAGRGASGCIAARGARG